jgi:hypothetical protein
MSVALDAARFTLAMAFDVVLGAAGSAEALGPCAAAAVPTIPCDVWARAGVTEPIVDIKATVDKPAKTAAQLTRQTIITAGSSALRV